MVITDSGGLQKEAFFHCIPCITLRDETEWIETVNFGFNQLVGADQEKIIQASHKIRQYENTKNTKYLVMETLQRKL